MKTETEYKQAEVTVTLDAGHLLSLERNGEVKASPDGVDVSIGITTEEETYFAYEDTDNAVAIVVEPDELMELARGDKESIHWNHNRLGTAKDPFVRLTVE